MLDSPKSKNIVWHEDSISKAMREERNGHKGFTLWFTGLSGSGKSTLSHAVQEKLFEQGCQVYVLDGDNVRHGLNRNLGFSPQDRTENIRRIGEVAKLFNDAGMIVATAFISPYRQDRDNARAIMPDGEFIEIWLNPTLEVCEERDPKGLYQKARRGEIPEFTGISAPYEEPLHPEVTINTGIGSIDQGVEQIIDYLVDQGYLAKPMDQK